MMSVKADPKDRGLTARLAAVRRADACADDRLTGAIDDIFLPDDARLDERARIEVGQLLGAVVHGIETDIRRHAARILSGRGSDALAEALLREGTDITARLSTAGLLRDRDLMDEMIARVRTSIIGEALPIDAADGDGASLMIRLADSADGVIAGAARQLLAAQARGRGTVGPARPSDLSAELHHRLSWLIAATIREAVVADDGEDPATDRAIVEATQRSLSAHDEGDRPEAAAARLALAIDARADELGPLLIEALRDRQFILFIACLAHALGLDYPMARAIVVEPEGDRLWFALRALDLDRATVARIGLSLADADPRRDLERFADDIDQIAAIPVDVARGALAPLSLHHDLRAAIDALRREGGR
jgi:hypothetical protein